MHTLSWVEPVPPETKAVSTCPRVHGDIAPEGPGSRWQWGCIGEGALELAILSFCPMWGEICREGSSGMSTP